MIKILLILFCTLLSGQTIFLDGRFDDWENIQKLQNDPVDDGNGELDLLSVSVAADSARLFFRLELARELSLSSTNKLTLLIDTDNDPSTGYIFNDIGAELMWVFGEKQGAIFEAGDSFKITHSDIGLVTLPTVTSKEFEIGINRLHFLNDNEPAFPTDSFRFLFYDNMVINGDQLPDNNGSVLFVIPEYKTNPWKTISIVRRSDNDIRILSQNTLNDGMFNEVQEPAQRRIYQALKPDIIAFQEMWNSSNKSTVEYINSILPLPDDKTWYSTEMEGHVVTVSRFPILNSWSIWGNNGSRIMAVLIQVRETGDSNEILIINSHWSCCRANKWRQKQADATIAFLKDAYQPGGDIALKPFTPVVVIGDLNLVGDNQQLTTLITGDIQDEKEYGKDFAPDWDGTDMTDLLPMHTSERVAYTWRSDQEGWSPGRLDYNVYTDFVLEVQNHFIINTRTMTEDELLSNGLLRSDSENASDHLTLVADFKLIPVPKGFGMKLNRQE